MANSSKKKSGLQRGESKAAFLFCTPAVVLALVFIILPFAMSVVYSFTNKQLIPKVGMETAFVGLKNYIEIFTSKVTVLSFKNTFLYALIVVPSVLVIGTVLAVFVNQKIKGVQVFRLIYFRNWQRSHTHTCCMASRSENTSTCKRRTCSSHSRLNSSSTTTTTSSKASSRKCALGSISKNTSIMDTTRSSSRTTTSRRLCSSR